MDVNSEPATDRDREGEGGSRSGSACRTACRWFIRHGRWGAAIVAVAVVLGVWQGARIGVDADIRVLLEGDQRNLATYDKVEAILDRQVVVVVTARIPDLFTEPGLETLRAIGNQLESLPEVADVKSLTHSVRPVRRGFSFAMEPFVPEGPLSDSQVEEIRDFALEHPLVRNLLVAGDGQHAVLTVTMNGSFETPAARRFLGDSLRAVFEPFSRDGVAFQTLGLPLAEAEIEGQLRHDIRAFAIWGAAILMTVLVATLRSWRLLVAVLMNQVAVLVVMTAAIRLLDRSVTLYLVMLFPLLSALQLTLQVHLLTAYRYCSVAGGGVAIALERAVESVFKACLFAAVTTAIGLVSLTICDVPQVRDFGWLGATGMVLVFLWSFGPGLSVTRCLASAGPMSGSVSSFEVERAGIRMDSEPRPDGAGRSDAIVGRYVSRLGRARWWVALAAAGVTVVSVAGWYRVRTDIRAVEFLNPDSPTRRAVETFDRIYGGINLVQIAFDTGRSGGVNDPSFLAYLDEIEKRAMTMPDVSGTYSYAGLLAMMNQIWEREAPGSYRVPTNPLVLNVFVMALKAGNYPFLTALADESLRTAHLIVRSRDMPASRYIDFVRSLERYALDRKPEGVSVSAARGIHSILEADRRIRRAQGWSLLLTLAAVGAVMALLWRSIRLAALALITNVIPVIAALGLAGWLDFPLNSITVMVAALVLGVAIDDAVHLITRCRENRDAGLSPHRALTAALRLKAPAILCTSLILSGVFGAFQVFDFPPIQHFGWMASFAFLIALISVTVVLPALIGGAGSAENGAGIEGSAGHDDGTSPQRETT